MLLESPKWGRMSFEEEWAQHVANGNAQRDIGMRLNHADGGGGSRQGKKLHVTPSLLRDRAEKAEKKAAKEFRSAHKQVIEKTSEVPGSMVGFSCDDALSGFVESWGKGVKYVAGQIGNEGLAKALREAASSFKGEDVRRGESFHEKYEYKPGDVI